MKIRVKKSFIDKVSDMVTLALSENKDIEAIVLTTDEEVYDLYDLSKCGMLTFPSISERKKFKEKFKNGGEAAGHLLGYPVVWGGTTYKQPIYEENYSSES